MTWLPWRIVLSKTTRTPFTRSLGERAAGPFGRLPPNLSREDRRDRNRGEFHSPTDALPEVDPEDPGPSEEGGDEQQPGDDRQGHDQRKRPGAEGAELEDDHHGDQDDHRERVADVHGSD